MKILDAGHRYELAPLDGTIPQILQFVKRVGDKFPFNTGEACEGTNCQEVLRVLIDRCRYLYHQQPCVETQSIIGLLEAALLLFELRAARCHERHINLDSIDRLISGPLCKTCGHYGCTDSHPKEAA